MRNLQLSQTAIRQARIELTNECSRFCTFCYNESEPSPNTSPNELSLEEHLIVLGKLHDVGCKYISFTGGEPLKREQKLVSLVKYATDLEMFVNLATNGDLLTSQVVKELKTAGLKAVQLTLNSSSQNKNLHDRDYGKGHYDNTLHALENVIRGDIERLVVRYTFMPHNIEEVVPTFLFITEKTVNYKGMTFFKIRECVDSGRAQKNQHLRLNNLDVKKIYKSYELLFQQPSHVIIALTEPYTQKRRGPQLVGKIEGTEYAPKGRQVTLSNGTRILKDYCACSKDGGIITINSQGEVIPCIFRPGESIGNVRENSIESLWKKVCEDSSKQREFGQLCAT